MNFVIESLSIFSWKVDVRGVDAYDLTRLMRLPWYSVLACGSMVLPNSMFFVFALCERKNEKDNKEKYRSAEGYEGISDATE